MSCERFANSLDLDAAGELDAATAAALERHAAGCGACQARIAEARERLAELEACLARCRVGDDFVARTMAQVRLEPPRAEEPLVPRVTHPVLRYLTMAAAAALFILAGYGFLRGTPSARFVGGPMARIGREAASLVPGAALSSGDIVATPRAAKEVALVDLARGRMRAAVKPASVLRIADPRCGTVAHLSRGGVIMGVREQGGCSAVSTPLARVTALGGAVSVHVVPQAGASGEGGFSGLVTLKAHDGWARVQIASYRGGAVMLRPGQALILRSGRRVRAGAQPLAYDEIRRRLERQREGIGQRLEHFRRQWEDVSRMVRFATPEEMPRLFIHGVRFQAEINKSAALQREIDRRLDLLHRIEQDPEILPVLRRER